LIQTSDNAVALVELRCECGETVSANTEKNLIRLARRHYREAHPALGQMPAHTILSMAEKKENAQ